MTEVMRLKREHDRKNPELMQDALDPAVMAARREARRLEARKKEMDLLRANSRQQWAEYNRKAEAKRESRERKRRREDIVEAVCLAIASSTAFYALLVMALRGAL